MVHTHLDPAQKAQPVNIIVIKVYEVSLGTRNKSTPPKTVPLCSLSEPQQLSPAVVMGPSRALWMTTAAG